MGARCCTRGEGRGVGAAAGALVGLVLFVQSFGDLANFNPHLHVLAADGVFGADGTFYELIPEGKYASLDWLAEFAEAYRLMREGDLARAADRFEALHARVTDPVTAYHAQACRKGHPRETDQS